MERIGIPSFVKGKDYIQKLAIQQNGLAIQHIPCPSKELCLLACEKNGMAIQYIDNPTEEMWEIAVKQNGMAIQFMNFVSNLDDIESESESEYTTPLFTAESELNYPNLTDMPEIVYLDGETNSAPFNNFIHTGNRTEGWVDQYSDVYKSPTFDSTFNLFQFAYNSELPPVNYSCPFNIPGKCRNCKDNVIPDLSVMCDNGCNTITCICGDEYHRKNDGTRKGSFLVKGHHPNCGKDNDDDIPELEFDSGSSSLSFTCI